MRDKDQQSTVALFCAAIMEAGWLTAAVITPVFFNLYTARIFEPDKIALLRSIAVLTACAWIICFLERGEIARQHLIGRLRTPLVLSAVAFVALSLLATATSVAPDLSFFGSYRRMQGTYTTLCYVIFFAVILAEMRSRQQVNRLFTAIILGSLPVAFYGIVQRLGMDPLTWNFAVADRAASTMGNPIFTGAYLGIVSLLTLGRIGSDLRESRKSRPSLPDLLRIGSYGLAALAQVLALGSTGSRGPWVGWLAGIFFLCLLLAALSRRRLLIAGFIAASAMGGILLLALNLPNGPLQHYRTVPYLSSFSHLLEGERGTGKVRTLIWEGNVRLALPHESIRYPDGTNDPLNPLRPFIGYGPETMTLIYSQFYPAEIGHYEYRTLLIDRSHNEIWDALVTTGLPGLIGYQCLLVCLFLFGLQRIGLLSTARERNVFLALWTGGGIGGGLTAVLLHQPKYFALGLALGTVTGMILSILMAALSLPRHAQTRRLDGGSRILIASLLAAILGHYVEVQFGVAVAGTRLLFWVAAGLLAAIGSGQLCTDDACPAAGDPLPAPASIPPAAVPVRAKAPSPSRHSARIVGPGFPLLHPMGAAGLWYPLVNALLLALILYAFTHNHERLGDPLAVLWRSLTYVIHQHRSSSAVLGLVIAVWTLSSLIAAGELSRSGRLTSLREWLAALALLASASLGMTLLFGLGLAHRLANLVPSSPRESVLISAKLIGIYDFFCLALVAAFLLAGLALLYGRQPAGRFARRPRTLCILLPALLGGGYLWISHANLDPIRADILMREGGIHQSRNRPDDAIAHFRRAVAFWPSDICYAKLGGAFAHRAVSADPAPGGGSAADMPLSEVVLLDTQNRQDLKRSDLFSAARTLLLHARGLNPLSADHSNSLARLYRSWTSLTTDPLEKARRAEQTIVFYQQAVTISPQNVSLWNELAWFTQDQKNDGESALRTIAKSIALDQEFAPTYLAAGDIYLKQQNLDKAAEQFRRALTVNPDLAEAYDRLAYIFYRQGKYGEAIDANRNILRIMPAGPTIWRTHKNLAILYAKTGDHRSALSHAEQGFAGAPADARQEMAALRAEIRPRINGAGKPVPDGR